jgi:hypothetical protein
MIDNHEIETMIGDEMTGAIEPMLADVQAVLRICAVMVSPRWLQGMQDRLAERVAGFPSAVMARGPFKTVSAARVALEREVLFVAAAIDGGN